MVHMRKLDRRCKRKSRTRNIEKALTTKKTKLAEQREAFKTEARAVLQEFDAQEAMIEAARLYIWGVPEPIKHTPYMALVLLAVKSGYSSADRIQNHLEYNLGVSVTESSIDKILTTLSSSNYITGFKMQAPLADTIRLKNFPRCPGIFDEQHGF